MASKLQQALAGVSSPNVSLKGIQGAGFQAQQVQAQQVHTTNYQGQLTQLMQMGAQASQTYVDAMEKRGLERRNEILLKNMSPQQIGEMRSSGTLLYQDDPYAMRALNRELGRQEAYSIDAIVRERIANGDYASRSAMEADRNDMMSKRRAEMSKAYGVAEDDEHWVKGWSSDMVERNMAIYDAQARKQDQMHRNETRVVVENNLGSIVRTGNGHQAMNYLMEQRKAGLIRNDAELETYAGKAIKDLAQQPHAIDQVRQLLTQPIELYGQKTTLRDRLGDEFLRGMENTAAESTLKNNWETQKWWTQNANMLINPDFSQPGMESQAIDIMTQMEDFANKTQGEAATQVRMDLEHIKAKYNEAHKRWNDQKRTELIKKQQQHVRVSEIDRRVEGRLSGDSSLSLELGSFQQTDATGAFTANDWNVYYSQKVEEINANKNLTRDQQIRKQMQLGALLKNEKSAGFGAHYNAMNQQASGEMVKYLSALNAGVDVNTVETPVLNDLMEMYKVDKALFVSTFGGDSAIATQIAMASNMGLHPSVIAQGQKRLDDLKKTPEVKQQVFQEFSTMESNDPIYSRLNMEQREMLQSAYLGMDGLDNAAKVRMLKQHMEDQYQVFEPGFFGGKVIQGIIPKTFLMTDPKDPSSASIGAAKLESYLTGVVGVTGNTGITVMGDSIVISDDLRSAPIILTKEQLQEQFKLIK